MRAALVERVPRRGDRGTRDRLPEPPQCHIVVVGTPVLSGSMPHRAGARLAGAARYGRRGTLETPGVPVVRRASAPRPYQMAGNNIDATVMPSQQHRCHNDAVSCTTRETMGWSRAHHGHHLAREQHHRRGITTHSTSRWLPRGRTGHRAGDPEVSTLDTTPRPPGHRPAPSDAHRPGQSPLSQARTGSDALAAPIAVNDKRVVSRESSPAAALVDAAGRPSEITSRWPRVPVRRPANRR
jgi:hypothetical protein